MAERLIPAEDTLPYWLLPFRRKIEALRQKNAATRRETERLRQENAALRKLRKGTDSLRQLLECPDKLQQIVETSIIAPTEESPGEHVQDTDRIKYKFKDVGIGLRPCPHCDSANLRGPHCTEYHGDTYAPTWWVECEECPASMTVSGETPEPLIAAWNRRSPRQSPDPKLLESLAIRYRHDFGLLDTQVQKAILGKMRQLWEEVVGLGFYKP